MKKITYQKAHEPTVFITKNKQRIKQYNNTVYLNNGDEFELELFNPLTEKVLAKIKINNQYIDNSGIILRPGERVFLERYLNEAKKFVYSIYEVEADNPVVQKAIENNGDVEVEFHKEQFNNQIIWSSNTWPYDLNDHRYRGNPPDYLRYTDGGTTAYNADVPHTLTNFVDNNTLNVSDQDNFVNYSANMSVEETGRVEKGSYSDQEFVYDNAVFESWSTWSKSWKILPASKKPVYKEEIKVYCTECGARRKKSSFKFCPNCGNKF